MKKLLTLLLALVMLTGCSSMLSGSREYSAKHNSGGETDEDPMYIEVSSSYDLRQAIISFVEAHEDEGIVRFNSYLGDMEADLNKACIFVTNDSALGSYSVSYIGSSLNRIVSYYEATISIIYKKEADEIASIIDIGDDMSRVETVVRDMLDTCQPTAAVRTTNEHIYQDTFQTTMTDLYYSDPQLIVALPELRVNQYSDAYSSDRIYELIMDYPESSPVMLGKRNAFKTVLEQMFDLESIEDKNVLLYKFCQFLEEKVIPVGDMADDEYDPAASINTAYGALYVRSADSEGIAMALKLLCNWKNIDCQVVIGRYNNNIHGWNMVNVDGDWYHFDLSRIWEDPAAAMMLTDEAMAGAYSWDTGAYPECKGTLDYTFLTQTAEEEEEPEEQNETPEDSTEETPGEEMPNN